MSLETKTTKWLNDALARYQRDLPLLDEGEEKKLCEIGLRKVIAELDKRAASQKKIDQQPTAKVEQLPDTEKIKRAVLKPSLGIPSLNETPEKLLADQKRQPGLLEQVINLVAPPSAPEQIIEIEIDGEIESYGLEELRDKARTWFTQTAEGAAIQGKGKLEKSVQYRRLCAVVPNWKQFYGYEPKVQDLHRRHNLHGEAVKNAAVRLLQILTA